jgi:hypothetical protein
MKRQVTISSACVELGLSKTSVNNWIKRLGIQKERIGRNSYVTGEDISEIRNARIKPDSEELKRQPDTDTTTTRQGNRQPTSNQLATGEVAALMAHIASLEQRLTESSDRESKLIAQAETSQDTIRGILGENTRLNQLLIAGPAEASNFVDITPVKKQKKKPKKKPKKKRK